MWIKGFYSNIFLKKALQKLFSSIFIFTILATNIIVAPLSASADSKSVCSNYITVNAGDTVLWVANLSGSGGIVTFAWTGTAPISGNTSSTTVTYTTAGNKVGTITVDVKGSNTSTTCDSVSATIISSNPTNTPPTITLNGNNPLFVNQNASFVDPMATAFDAEDQDITANIIVTGSVNTSVLGTTTLIYSVTDSGGLSASTTRQVVVIPVPVVNTPPTITLLGDNPFQYTIGDVFSDPGATANDVEDGILTSAIVVTGNLSTTTAGTYTRTYTVTDSGGLSASVTRTIVVSNPSTRPTATCETFTTVTAQQFVEWRTTVISPSLNPTYVWTGSDGLTGNTATVTKTYATAGIKTAKVVVTADSHAVCDIAIITHGTNTPPVITIKGDNPYYIFAGGTFDEQGFSAIDNEDGDLTEQVTLTGSINTSVLGTTTLIYSVTDSGGLTASTTRTVVVVPAPVCTISLPSPMATTVTVNNSFTYTITATSTSSTTITYYINEAQLPSGVTATTTNGSLVISGTPTVDGVYQISVSATNACGTYPGGLTITVEKGGGGGTQYGKIQFCKVIKNTDGVIATSSNNLPTGTFGLNLLSSTSTNNIVKTFNWSSATFVAGTKLLGGLDNDAMCIDSGDIAVGNYYYTAETISGSSAWGTAKYNDQDTSAFNNVFDVFDYNNVLFNSDPSDDANGNRNSDGFVELTVGNSNRTVVILNTYTSVYNNAPTIHILGNNPLEFIIGSTWSDPGATSTDMEDGDLTPNIIASSTVSTTTAGTYSIVYSVVDSGGLWAYATRTVQVKEAPITPPTCTNCGGGGGGGGVLETLYINNERITDLGNGEVLINWNTNSTADSRVVFGLASTTVIATMAPLFGYERTSATFNQSNFVIDHAVGIAGLEKGKTYFLRPVSTRFGLTAFGKELTFTYGDGGGIMEPPVIGSCTYLRDFLRKDLNNDRTEVFKLQLYLNRFEGFNNLSATGVFDDATLNAVLEYQERYRGEILNPWGSNIGTGYVYLLTRKHINEAYCKKAFPLNSLQEQEIAQFRAFIEALNASGITNGGQVSPEDTGNRDNPDVNSGIIGGVSTTTGGNIAQVDNKGQNTEDDKGQDIGQISKIRSAIGNTAAAAFAFPQSTGEAMKEVGILIGILAIIYLICTAIVNVLYGIKDKDYRTFRLHKIMSFIIAIFILLVISIALKVSYLILPMFILLALLVIFGAYLVYQKYRNPKTLPLEI